MIKLIKESNCTIRIRDGYGDDRGAFSVPASIADALMDMQEEARRHRADGLTKAAGVEVPQILKAAPSDDVKQAALLYTEDADAKGSIRDMEIAAFIAGATWSKDRARQRLELQHGRLSLSADGILAEFQSVRDAIFELGKRINSPSCSEDERDMLDKVNDQLAAEQAQEKLDLLGPKPADKMRRIEDVPAGILRELWVSEQLPHEVYISELDRRSGNADNMRRVVELAREAVNTAPSGPARAVAMTKLRFALKPFDPQGSPDY